jgi:ribosomal protein S27AE
MPSEKKSNRRDRRIGIPWTCQKCGSTEWIRCPKAKDKFGKSIGGRHCAKCGAKRL